MTLEKAAEFLDSFINHEVTPRKYEPGRYVPDRVGKMLAGAGLDAGKLKIIHIAGTKGKGSTAHYSSSLIESAGNFKVGLYTSPHVLKINERIRINSESISDSELILLIEKYIPYIQKYNENENATYFDVLTFLAIAYFLGNSCDYAVLETGLGGRLDSTNFCMPEVSIISSIGFDHTAVLGGTLREIAGEKAGIIKKARPAVSALLAPEALERVKSEAVLKNSPFFYFPEHVDYKILERTPRGGVFSFKMQHGNKSYKMDNVYISEQGDVFILNFLLSLLALSAAGLDFSEEGIRKAARTRIPFRVEKRGDYLIDVAHNDSSLESLFKTLTDYFRPECMRLYIGILSDKEIKLIAAKIIEYESIFDRIVVFDFASPRVSGGKALFELISHLERAEYSSSIPQVAHERGLLNVFTGSFQLIDKVLDNISIGREEYAAFLNSPLDIPEWEKLYDESAADNIPVLRPVCARLLYFITRIASPRDILEIGTGSAYSTLWLGRGVSPEARITSIERDLKRFKKAKIFFSGIMPSASIINCDALKFLEETPGMFDLVFLDAQKRDYPEYLALLKNRIRPGGILFADNFLFGGMSAEIIDEKREKYLGGARLLRSFNEELSRSNAFESLFLSIEDGVVIAIRK
jgi:dihydrofolate synthase/folylpolyglutamate synthase